ncbi:MAG: GxxExxY protein [bacterium]
MPVVYKEVIELKTVERLLSIHEAQILTYLKWPINFKFFSVSLRLCG